MDVFKNKRVNMNTSLDILFLYEKKMLKNFLQERRRKIVDKTYINAKLCT